MYNKMLFAEHNPNPLIEINKTKNVITYINPSARAQFTSLEKEGTNHPILCDLNESIASLMDSQSELIIMVREIVFFNITYEQQIFAVPENDIIFVYMNNITAYKQVKDKATQCIQKFEEQEREYKSQLESMNSKLEISHQIFKRSKELHDLALRSAKAGTWNWHVIGDVFVWDDNMIDLFGFPTNIYSGNSETILKLVHPEDRQQLTSELKLCLERPIQFDSKFRIIKTDGSLRYLNFKGKAYSDNHNQLTGLTGICLDITP